MQYHKDVSKRVLAILILSASLLPATRTAPVAPALAGGELIPKNAVWKYDDTNVDLGSDWRTPSYNDSAWASGAGILGYGESFITTTLERARPTYYFRRAFELNVDPATVAGLNLRVNHDDGFVAYLNGTEIRRGSMPSGEINFNTFANSHEGGSYTLYNVSVSAGLLRAGENLLAIEVHNRSLSSSDIVMDASLEYSSVDDPVQLVRGPYLNCGSSRQVVVRWRTDVPATGFVRYGTDSLNLDKIVTGTEASTEHEIKVESLAPDTRYYYAIGTGAELLQQTGDMYFVTNPPEGIAKPARIWIIGDSGTANRDATNVYNAYRTFTNGTRTDIWVMLGDNAYDDGTDDEYQAAVFETYPEMLRSSVLWPAFGNHDGHSARSGSETGPFYDIFTLPREAEAGGYASGTEAYYSFDYGNIHFICLNSHDVSRSTTGPMLTWLQDDLARNTQDWTIAFWHHPPYTKGSHDSDSESQLVEMRQNALPILEAGGIDLAFFGHSHSYERSFLLDGHYGRSTSLLPEMVLDLGNGQENGDGAYGKRSHGPAPREGAVYVVAGNAGKTSGGDLDHPAMYRSLNVLGSLVLDIDGSRADLQMLDDDGVVRDAFTLIKGAGRNALPAVALTAPAPESVVAVGEQLTFQAAASDNDGSVVQVAFFVDSTNVGIDSTAPFEASWTAANGGSFAVWAEATDDSGAVRSSKISTITVGPATSIKEEDSAPPNSYDLSAAFPNPFNPETAFTISVANSQQVRIEVLDVRGRRVRVLHEGVVRSGDERRFRFDAAGMDSGVYLLQVEGERFRAVRKMLLLK